MGTVITAKVVAVIDDYTIAINQGSNGGVAKNQKYLIYYLGKELFDPDTKESLGKLEIVCGEAIVVHVQPKIATLKSNSFNLFPKKIVRKPSVGVLSPFNMPWGQSFSEEEERRELLPFDDVHVGYLVKQIA
jgi:hypothetical protein